MRSKIIILFSALIIFACLFVWWLKSTSEPENPPQVQPVSEVNTQEISTYRPLRPSVRHSVTNSSNRQSTILPTQRAARNSISDAVNTMNFPINFYGKIVDQNTNGLGNVQIRASVRVWGVNVGSGLSAGSTKFNIESRDDGTFQIIGATGDVLEIDQITKDGYELSPSSVTIFNYERVRQGISSAPNPIIFKMRKKNPHQELVAKHISRVAIPCDGSPVFFDLKNGTKNSGNHDLRVTFYRTPLNLPPGKRKYDWTATFEISSGGIVEAADEFLVLAPEAGYKSEIKIEMDKNSPNWTEVLKREFYFYSNGKFGRLSIRLTTNYQPPPTGLTMDIVMNPSGSRILE